MRMIKFYYNGNNLFKTAKNGYTNYVFSRKSNKWLSCIDNKLPQNAKRISKGKALICTI